MRTSSINLKKRSLRRAIHSNPNLQSSDFSNTRTVLSIVWLLFVLSTIFILAGLSGIASAQGLKFSILIFEAENVTLVKLASGVAIVFVSLFALCSVTLRGFLVGVGFTTLLLIISSSLCFIAAQDLTLVGLMLFYGIMSIFLIWFALIASSLATVGIMSVIPSRVVAIISNLVISLSIAKASTNSVATFVAGIVVVLGNYVGLQSLEDDSKFSWLRDAVVSFITVGGVSFRKTNLNNLTKADFSGAILRYADLRDANLTHTCWRDVKGLEFSRLDNTYLANPKIRQLVVTCNGQGQNFDGLDLTGVNLQDATLQDASFIGANLNQSNLRGADLSRAVLKQTQLDAADLTDAILTGACIEDWGMTSTTKLKNVQCDYVYMRLTTPEKRNPLRKPDDERRNFSEDEFADFIKPYFDTLDLYHRQDVDPRSISIALKNLVDNHPDAQLQFVAIEWRGNGLNIRYTTAPDVTKSELNHEYFINYARVRRELLGSIQLRLAAQDAEINRMEGVINKFIQTGTHQSTIQAETIQMIQGELVMTENRGIHINAGDNANIRGLSSGDGVVNLGTISGNVTNAINQLPEAPESNQLNLKELLTQLQQAIQADADLPDPDKSDLLEQVQALAEAKQAEEPAKREGLTRKAMKMFDATLKSLPDTAKIVEACSKLLPLVLKALGFPA